MATNAITCGGGCWRAGGGGLYSAVQLKKIHRSLSTQQEKYNNTTNKTNKKHNQYKKYNSKI